jgi:hypothetical protein
MSIARAVAAAGRAAARADGTKISYRRPGPGGSIQRIDDLPVLRGTSQFQTLDENNVLIEVRSQDFLIMADRLVLGDERITPERGDQVVLVEKCPPGERVFELLDMPGEPSWRWSDQYKTRYRVHTKEVANPE